MVYFFKS